MTNDGISHKSLDDFISRQLRSLIEDRYWAVIEQVTAFERLIVDPEFRNRPDTHLGLFSDHGIGHVRDVANRILEVSRVLVPNPKGTTDVERIEFITGTAVVLAYLHDVGMGAPIPRKVHAQFAAQLPFTETFEDIVDLIVAEDSGHLRSRVSEVSRGATFDTASPRDIIQQMLSFAACHSKSCVPASVLRSPDQLRTAMRHMCFTSLDIQFERLTGTATPFGKWPMVEPPEGAFDWLIDPRPAHRLLHDDIVLAVRIVRIADALRQRGTTFRTSSGYEIAVDPRSGDAIVLLRNTPRSAVYLMGFESTLSVGEANLRSALLRNASTLFLEFHRGAFSTLAVQHKVARCCAAVIDDIQQDVLGTLDNEHARIEIQAPADDATFAKIVRTYLLERMSESDQRTALGSRIDIIGGNQSFNVSLGNQSDDQHAYLSPRRELLGDPLIAEDVLLVKCGIVDAGANPAIRMIETETLLSGAMRISLKVGDILMAPGDPPAFVAFPMSDGLIVEPLGGYPSEMVAAWTVVGVPGVLRGQERNATVRALRDLDVVVVNADNYLDCWYRPYTAAELCDQLRPTKELVP